MKNQKQIWALFLTMLKIGLFAFGGGYAVVALIESELVSKKNWLTHDDFMDMVAIAESTPGPIAINSATYIGYKTGGVFGAALTTLGVVIPSFTIIFLISLFFDAFLSLYLVACAFRGIQVAVVYLILSAGIKMAKKLKKKPLEMILFSATVLCMVTLSLFSIRFSSILYILIGGACGLFVYAVGRIREGGKEAEK